MVKDEWYDGEINICDGGEGLDESDEEEDLEFKMGWYIDELKFFRVVQVSWCSFVLLFVIFGYVEKYFFVFGNFDLIRVWCLNIVFVRDELV